MKFFAPAVVGAIAFTSQVNANGVCYDPNHGTGMDANSAAADMKIIAAKGFTSVRTFISKFGNVELGPIIAGAGLKAMLGVPYPQGDYQEQMAAAIKAAQGGGVYAIMVGNENLAGNCNPPSDMISVIQSIKSQVPQGVYVGSVQRNTEGIECQGQYGWEQLIAACDKIGINAHPYFTPGTTADTAIDVLSNQWQSMSGAYGDKLILTETGWPSSGSLLGNVGSLVGAETFYNAYQQWSSSMGEKFYFQMFDTPYRSEEYEKTFGLVTSDSQDKFTMATAQVSTAIQQVGSVAQQTYEQTGSTVQQNSEQNGSAAQQTQTQTETPMTASTPEGTPAPTPEATPAPTPEATPASTPEVTPAPEATPAQTPEATTAVPEPTQVPTETPAMHQSSGSAGNTTTAGSSETQFGSTSTSGSVSGSGDAGFGHGSSTTSESSNHKQQTQEQQTQEQQKQEQQQQEQQTQEQQTQQTINSVDSPAQQQSDNAQKINNQSGGSGVSASVALGIGGGACAVLMAFGFIYQARKRAAELEGADDKRANFAITPHEVSCAL